ncbi:MAG: hypothetical protein WKG00_41120 [Polyangiaceae bacterium]
MIGNHDKNNGSLVRDRVAERHDGSGAGARYAVDWGPVRLLTLGDGPNDDDLAWSEAMPRAVRRVPETESLP